MATSGLVGVADVSARPLSAGQVLGASAGLCKDLGPTLRYGTSGMSTA